MKKLILSALLAATAINGANAMGPYRDYNSTDVANNGGTIELSATKRTDRYAELYGAMFEIGAEMAEEGMDGGGPYTDKIAALLASGQASKEGMEVMGLAIQASLDNGSKTLEDVYASMDKCFNAF